MQLLKFQPWSYLTEKRSSFAFITNKHQIVTVQLMAILSKVSGNKYPEIIFFFILLSMTYTALPTKKVINVLSSESDHSFSLPVLFYIVVNLCYSHKSLVGFI